MDDRRFSGWVGYGITVVVLVALGALVIMAYIGPRPGADAVDSAAPTSIAENPVPTPATSSAGGSHEVGSPGLGTSSPAASVMPAEPTTATSPFPSLEPTPHAPSASPVPTAIALPANMGADELEQFWGPLIETNCAGMIAERFWNSLPAMTRQVDLVVIGRPVAVGQRWISGSTLRQATVMRIAIDEVIKGTPVTREDGLIELELLHGTRPSALLELPANRHLFFLRSVAEQNEEYGLEVSEVDRYSYNLPSLYQNLLVELNGAVFVPAVDRVAAYDANEFPAPLHGEPFEGVLATVRDAAATGLRNDGVVGSMRFAC